MILGLLGKRLEQRRDMLKRAKLNRVRFWILSKGIKRGELKASPGLFKCAWNPNFSDLTVDAGRESRERRANVLAGLDTFTSYFSENGSNYSQEVKVRQSEIGLQCEAALALCEKYPKLPFEAALTRMAMLTPNANEMRGEAELASSTKSAGKPIVP